MADDGSTPQPGTDGGVTHSNVAVGLDLIDPEALLDQGARPAQQFFELPEGERPHLHIHGTRRRDFKQSIRQKPTHK